MSKLTIGGTTSTLAKSAQISAVVLNADGTVKKNLGVVCYWHKNPFKRLSWGVKQLLKFNKE